MGQQWVNGCTTGTLSLSSSFCMEHGVCLCVCGLTLVLGRWVQVGCKCACGCGRVPGHIFALSSLLSPMTFGGWGVSCGSSKVSGWGEVGWGGVDGLLSGVRLSCWGFPPLLSTPTSFFSFYTSSQVFACKADWMMWLCKVVVVVVVGIGDKLWCSGACITTMGVTHKLALGISRRTCANITMGHML